MCGKPHFKWTSKPNGLLSQKVCHCLDQGLIEWHYG